MQYTKLGRSNLTVSKICLGTMHFGTLASDDESYRIMDKAQEMGINFFDTANVYGRDVYCGRTEELIGNWFQKSAGRRDQTVLATKVYGNMVPAPQPPNEEAGLSAYKVRKHAADSLKRLQTDHIDLYQVHHIDSRISLEEFWTTFDRLINNGDVLYMGTSNYSGWGLAKYQMYALQHGMVGFVSEQSQYNLLSRYPELEVFPAAKDFGISIIPYMPLGGGILTGRKKADAGPRTSQVEKEYDLNMDTNQQLADFSALCQEIGEKEAVVAIAWVLANPAVASAIVGPRTVGHLDGLDRAAELQLDPVHIARLNDIFNINTGRQLKPNVPAPQAFAW
ncbi:MAG: aldo/keto reductase [Anaerolineae bacterium]|nr:aldo/keto reductase [Anaerolineae bacterium]